MMTNLFGPPDAQISDAELKLMHTRTDRRQKMLTNPYLHLDDLFEGYADAERVIGWSRVTAVRDMEEPPSKKRRSDLP